MSNLVVLPVVLPLATAVLLVALPWPRARVGASLTAAAATAALAGALIARVAGGGHQTLALGAWPAPFGIAFAADMLGALMVGIASWVALITLAFVAARPNPRASRFLHAGWLFLLAGMNGAFLTADLFNLYVFFEVMLVASYFLLTLGASSRQAREAFTYVAINLVASTFFLFGVALLYSATGTVNMADLAQRLPEAPRAPAQGGIALLAAAFGVKAAIFPLYFWLPHAYAIPPGGTAAYFGGMLTKVGVYALFRLFTTISPLPGPHPLLLAVAALTMTLGVLGALAQNEIRRVLSFHIVSQIGYMIMGLALATPLAVAGGIFYVLHHIGVKTALLLAGAAVEEAEGTGRLDRLSGLMQSYPALMPLFLVPALSLAGMPPLSGFWAKLALVRAGLDAGQTAVVAVSIIVSLLTLLSMTKILVQAFWGEGRRADPIPAPRLAAVGAMAALTVVWGLGGHLLFQASALAAAHLLDPAGYAAAVLGGR